MAESQRLIRNCEICGHFARISFILSFAKIWIIAIMELDDNTSGLFVLLEVRVC